VGSFCATLLEPVLCACFGLNPVQSKLPHLLNSVPCQGERSRVLRLKRLPIPASLEHAGRVHGFLKCVAFPAENVIAVGSVACAITSTPDERLGAVRGPQGLIVKCSCVPQSLIGELWYADRMRGWARAGGCESSFLVSYM